MTAPPPPPPPPPSGAASLLAELMRSEGAQRAALLSRHGDPPQTLGQIIEHLESLMLKDLAAALEASAVVMETADQLESAKDVVPRLRARRARAQCFSYANRFAEAMAVLDEAAAIAAPTAERRELALINMTRLHALARLGRLDEAVRAGEAARADLLALGDQTTAAKADVNLGVVQRMRDRPAEALAHFERAQPVFAAQPMIIAQIESNRAEALLDLHDFEGAETAFGSALRSFETIGAARAAAIVEGNLADLMNRQGRFAEALHRFEQARRRIEHENAPGDAARLQAEAAEVQLQLGGDLMLAEAADASAAAASTLDAQGMAVEAARARMTLARALAALGHAGEAEKALLKASAQFESAGQPHQASRASLARAELIVRGGRDAHEASPPRRTLQIEEARSTVMELLAPLRERPADAAAAHALLAEIEIRENRSSEALAQVAIGLRLAEPLGLAPLIGRLHHLRGRALMRLGRFDEALDSLRTAAEHLERIRGSLQADRFRIAFQAGAAPLFADGVAAALRTSRPDRESVAFDLMERARSRALLDQLSAGAPEMKPAAEPDRKGAAETELQNELARWRSRLNALYTGLHESGGAGPGSRWQDELGEAERRLAAVESRLAAASPIGELFARPVALYEVNQHIPRGSALLEYFIAADRIMVFVIDSTREPVLRDLCSLSQIAPALERLRFQIARAVARGSAAPRLQNLRGGTGSADAQRELEELERLLIAPALEGLTEIDRLIIAPYGPLHALPFHAFRGQDQFLIERFEVRYIPSASILVQLGRPRPGDVTSSARRDESGRTPPRPLLVAVADERAPRIADEVRALAAILPDADILESEHATVAAVMQRAAGVPLLHIAAHGIFAASATGSQAGAGIRLADGWLTAREACGMRLGFPAGTADKGDGAIVTLSGCETGRSIAAEGDELVGLIRAFLMAGAKGVLGSLWAVHDQTATELLVSTYRMWYLQGSEPRDLSMAAALRSAQVDLARRGIHPAFWAPFFLVGNA